VPLRKSLPISITSKVSPTLACINFRVWSLILKSLMHFELILVQGDKLRPNFSFSQTANQFFQQFLLKRLSFLHHIF
jgi:hypothetical protein